MLERLLVNWPFKLLALTLAFGGVKFKVGFETDGGGGGQEIPEPGIIVLFGIGLLGLSYRRRRKTS